MTGYNHIQEQRNRLVHKGLIATILLLASAIVGLIGLIKESSSSRTDVYRILLTSLASQHHRMTGAETVLYEDERALDYFNHLHELKTKRDNLSEQPIELSQVRRDALLQFSFVPGTGGIQKYPFDYLASQPLPLTMTFNPPSGRPLAIWTYSPSEQLLVVVFAEQPLAEDLANPELRIIQQIDSKGAVAVEGNFRSIPVVLIHAYLLPIEKLQLDSTFWSSVESEATFKRVIGFIPQLYDVNPNDPMKYQRLDGSEVLALAKANSPSYFYKVAEILRWIVLPGLLFYLVVIFARVFGLYRQWNSLMADLVPNGQVIADISFIRFLWSDLSSQAERVELERESKRREAARIQHEQECRTMLEAEIQHLIERLAQFGHEVSFDERIISEASNDELETLVASYSGLVQEHEDRIERELQADRERERQIQWLVNEFASIPKEKKAEVSKAWSLYEQACVVKDQKKKLEILKAARKLLPKEYRDYKN